MKYIIAISASLLAAPAFAQTATPPTPEMQALGATVMSCVQEGVSLRTQIFALQAELTAAKAPAKDAPKPSKAP